MSDLNQALPEEVAEPEVNPNTNAPPPDWTSTFLDEDEDIEIGDVIGLPPETPAGTPNDEVATLQAQLKEQQERLQALQIENTARNAIQPVVEQLSQLQPKQPVQAVQQPGESDDAFRKRIDESYLETGLVSSMDEYFARRLRPEVQRLLQNNLYTSRRLAMLDPEKGPLYKKYQREVEDHIAQLPPQDKLYNPEVYDNAVAAVAAKHGDEIIDERVQRALEAEREKIKEELLKEMGHTAPGRPVHNATPTQQAPPAARTSGRKISLEQLKMKYPEHVQAAAARGIPTHVYFRTLAKKGMLK